MTLMGSLVLLLFSKTQPAQSNFVSDAGLLDASTGSNSDAPLGFDVGREGDANAMVGTSTNANVDAGS